MFGDWCLFTAMSAAQCRSKRRVLELHVSSRGHKKKGKRPRCVATLHFMAAAWGLLSNRLWCANCISAGRHLNLDAECATKLRSWVWTWKLNRSCRLITSKIPESCDQILSWNFAWFGMLPCRPEKGALLPVSCFYSPGRWISVGDHYNFRIT
jgi:hypothetical protein